MADVHSATLAPYEQKTPQRIGAYYSKAEALALEAGFALSHSHIAA